MAGRPKEPIDLIIAKGKKHLSKEEIDATVIKEKLLDVTSVNVTWNIKEDLEEDLHHIGILYEVKIKETKLKDTPDGIDSNGGLWIDIDKLSQENTSPLVWYSLKLLGYI